MHPKHIRGPRERAARALCEYRGRDPDKIEGAAALWERYLPEVDVVLIASLSVEDWLRLQADEAERSEGSR